MSTVDDGGESSSPAVSVSVTDVLVGTKEEVAGVAGVNYWDVTGAKYQQRWLGMCMETVRK